MMIPSSFQIIAHRGASADAPENTMESFRLGLDQGADAIECDVHLSRDGELVVIHDATLQRTAGVAGAVKETSLAELKTLDVGSWKSSTWHSARIPALAEVLDFLPVDRRIFIEIKTGLSAIPPLKKVVEASALPLSQMVLMEFDLTTVLAMKTAFPGAEVLWLNEFPRLSFPWQKERALRVILKTAHHHGLDGINLQNIPQVDAKFLQICRARGLNCYCWTVDDPSRAAALIEHSINGIATNRPGWMREQPDLTRSL